MLTTESMQYFYELYESIPRQGPGLTECTERALRFLPPLSGKQRILDVGCGSGAQTLVLAKATLAEIIALDSHEPFLEKLKADATQAGVADRITTFAGNMDDMPFKNESFDVIWSEGAIFIIGFAQGLAKWRKLLVPGGYIVVSEMCWFCDNPAPELIQFCGGEGAVAGIADRRKTIADAGYLLMGDFVLPPEGWWQNYLLPVEKRLDGFAKKYSNTPVALSIAEHSRHEIELYKKYSQSFGYVFFVMQKAD